MRNILLKIIRVIECLYGLFFLIGLCGSSDEFLNLDFWISFIILAIIMFAPLEILHNIIKRNINNQRQNSAENSYTENNITNDNFSPNSSELKINSTPTNKSNSLNHNEVSKNIVQTPQMQYIETSSTIYRTDKDSISDKEVSYLMQIDLETALRNNGMTYIGQVLDTSFIQERDKNKDQYTRIPSYNELSIIEPAKTTMCSTDIFFLKYIDGLCLHHPFIAQYWYYDYGLNYSAEIKKLIASGLLTLSTVNINKFTVEKLKKILRHFNLPLTGKRQTLQERILSNISINDLSDYLGNEIQYFCATPEGKDLIDTIHESATKNLELENKCIALIMKFDFKSALSLISNFKASTPNGANLIPHYSDHLYMETMDNTLFFHTLEKDRDLEPQIRASIVFCRMYGCTQDKLLKLIQRIYADNNRDFNEYTKKILNAQLL